jgi:hypothetical protein
MMKILLLLPLFCILLSELRASDFYVNFESEKNKDLFVAEFEEKFGFEPSMLSLYSKESHNYSLKTKNSNSPNPRLTLNKLNGNTTNRTFTETELFLLNTYRLAFPEDGSDKLTFKTIDIFLKNSQYVSYAEPCPVFEKHCADYDDPLASSQALLDIIQLCEAAGIEQGDENIVIALSDDGLNYDHEDVIDGLWTNNGEIVDGIDNDNNGYIDDYQGYSFYEDRGGHHDVFAEATHGSMVGGIFAARPGNGTGIIGTGLNSSIFPIRVSPDTSTGPIRFGYESIIYAAVMGFDVINCSWGGTRNETEIGRYITRLANERNLTIVSSAGNRKFQNDNIHRYTNQLPSLYEGVIAVGQMNELGNISNTTNIGSAVDIYAPGLGNLTISHTNDGAYASAENGTSFSAPVVAGVVGLIKSRYPGLSNFQIESHLKNTADNPEQSLQEFANLEPQRVNAYRAVSEDPFDKPGIRVLTYEYRDMEGNEVFDPDTDKPYQLVLTVRNELGDAANLSAELLPVFGTTFIEPNDKLQIINSIDNLSEINSGALAELSFEVIIRHKNYEKILLNLVLSTDDHRQARLVEIHNSNNIYDFTNGVIGVSVAENGLIGYTTKPLFFETRDNEFFGKGLYLNNFASLLYNGFLFAFEEDRSIVATAGTGLRGQSELESIEGFSGGDKMVVKTDNAGAGMDLQINTRVLPSDPANGFLEFKIWSENMYFEQLFGAGVGMYLDIDLAKNMSIDVNFNVVEDSRAELPIDLQRPGVAMATVSRPDSALYFSYAVRSDDDNAIAQLNAATISNLDGDSETDLLRAATSGVMINTPPQGADIATVLGMKWEGFWEVGEINLCTVCMAGGETKKESIDRVIDCLQNYSTSVENELEKDNNRYQELIYSKDDIIVLSQNESSDIIDIQGRLIDSFTGEYNLDLMSNGVYFLIVNQNEVRKFLLVD